MNFDNSIGMALYSGDLSGTASIGSRQGPANGMAESPQSSLFQQLINQMLTAQDQTTVAASGNLNTGEQNKSDGTGDLLSDLLLAGGNLSKIGLLKTGRLTGETAAEIKGASDEKQTSGENAAATDLIQTLMAGMTNTATAANVEKACVDIRAGQSEESKLAAINGDGTVSGSQAVQQILQQSVNNPALQSGLTVPTDGRTELTAATEGMTGIRQVPEIQKQMPQTGTGLETTNLSSGKAETTNGIVFRTSEQTVPTNGDADKPDASEPQSLLTPKAESGNQTAASEILTVEQAAAHADKPKQETVAADGTDPGMTGIQNSVQGAVTTGDIAETGTVNQTIESPQPYSQIREEILNKLEQNGPTEFKMQLEPEDLGQIDIKLKLSEGKLIIDILAADSRTQALLTSQVDKLISSMGLQNVQVESVQVSQQMNSQTQDNSQSQGFTMNSAMDFSQRRQEQHRQEILSNGKPAGTFGTQQDETQTNNTMNRIESIRFNNHRMNYSV